MARTEAQERIRGAIDRLAARYKGVGRHTRWISTGGLPAISPEDQQHRREWFDARRKYLEEQYQKYAETKLPPR